MTITIFAGTKYLYWTYNPRQNKSSQHTRVSNVFVFVVILTSYYLCLIYLSPDLFPSLQAMLMWPDFETLNLSCNGIDMSTAQQCLEWSRQYMVQKKTLICETCWILCCKAGFFEEFYPYHDIFLYLFWSKIV